MCGIVGLWRVNAFGETLYTSMRMLQHRGEEATGIVLWDGENFFQKRKLGLAKNVFEGLRENELDKFISGIGHLRYSTAGASNSLANAQPLYASCRQEEVFVAHNGNIPKFQEMKKSLEEEGDIFHSTSDTELILKLIGKSSEDKIELAIVDALSKIKGAFSLLFLTKDKLIAARDPWGFRPLSLASLDNGYIVASETCALDPLKAKFIRDIEPGEILTIEESGFRSLRLPKTTPRLPCIFELIYFARPDSKVFGVNAWEFRERLGKELAKTYGRCDGEVFTPIPDSGNFFASGFAKFLKIIQEEVFIRNHYTGRSYINPDDAMRGKIIKIKLNPIKGKVLGKSVVALDDSIVRGNTIRKIVRMLRSAGAALVKILIGSPPIQGPCYYGMDHKSYGELIAHGRTLQEIEKFSEADALKYLPLEKLQEIGREFLPHGFCDACFSKNYRV